jgi:hypothetical protein
MLLKFLNPPDGEEADWMGYPQPFMQYYYAGDAGKARLETQRKSARNEARTQLEEAAETRVEDAPGKRGGVVGVKRSLI